MNTATPAREQTTARGRPLSKSPRGWRPRRRARGFYSKAGHSYCTAPCLIHGGAAARTRGTRCRRVGEQQPRLKEKRLGNRGAQSLAAALCLPGFGAPLPQVLPRHGVGTPGLGLTWGHRSGRGRCVVGWAPWPGPAGGQEVSSAAGSEAGSGDRAGVSPGPCQDPHGSGAVSAQRFAYEKGLIIFF